MIIAPKELSVLKNKLKEKKLVLYGFGGAGIGIAAWCDENNIDFVFADRNASEKHKKTDKPIFLPSDLPEKFPDSNIVISSVVYYDEIKENLLKMGLPEENIIPYSVFMPETVTWKELEKATVWGGDRNRVEKISQLIPADSDSVADYGEGKINLKNFLPPKTEYFPIDYVKRSDITILCDFDRDTLPDIYSDVSVCTATLIFLKKAEELISHICRHTRNTVILSYVTTDVFSNITGRRVSGYLNDFSEAEIFHIMDMNGFVFLGKENDPANSIDKIYVFIKNRRKNLDHQT